MAKTLWEMIKSKIAGPLEFQITNPLRLRIGTNVKIDTLELNKLIFETKKLTEYSRLINNNIHVFTDYDLLARPLDQDEVKVKLRFMPLDNPDIGLTHNVVLLKSYYESEYDDNLYKAVVDTTKKFEVLENGVCTERYFRINDVQDSYKADLKVVHNKLTNRQVEYWDYWREIKNVASQEFTQFLFIEMDCESGWFQMWQGVELDPLQISVF